VPTATENREYWSSYDWNSPVQGGHGAEWTDGYGGPDNAWNYTVLPRIRSFLPCEHCLELGPGHGLWTERLRPLCRRMTLVDVTPECIEACRKRFGPRGMTYIANDGKSLPGIEPGSIDFVFSWHSLVHAERESIAGYLGALGRLMKPGGAGLIHHSNFGEYVDASTGQAKIPNDHWRGATMTAAAFREECSRSGLCCTYQEIVPWGSEHRIDCFSVFTRPKDGAAIGTVVEENDGFWQRVQDASRVAARYTHPFPEIKPAARRTFLGIPIGAR